ncbi:MAG TPA: rRNA maturation RNase YbeY [Candidatus Pelagibacter bacterium]|jgi:probable rRNA maturation factor|nr:rRNA maturation RNase YbeY [Candidatus Pelagibacter bacterium]|tara:strand:+ start:2751 stop:3197 length:447 start_codon:yes stop_codon:yes gene_type:complete
MIKANVVLDHYKWKNKIKNPSNYFKKKLNKLNKISSFKKKKHEFSVLLTNNKKMKSFNFKFRKKNKPTDVLSFPFHHIEKKSIYIGDIAISFEIVNQRSKTSNFFLEFDKMWIHGYFHLIGYDHKKIKDFKKMTKKENLVLNYFHKAI